MYKVIIGLFFLNTVTIKLFAQQPEIDREFWKSWPNNTESLVGKKIFFFTPNPMQAYGGMKRNSLFKSKINPEEFKGKTGVIIKRDVYFKQYGKEYYALYIKVADEKKDLIIELDKIESREYFPTDIGVADVLDSAKAKLIGRTFYDKEDRKIVVKDIAFTNNENEPYQAGHPFKFTLEVDGKIETINRNIKGNYLWDISYHGHDASEFGYMYKLKSNKAPLTLQDLELYFVKYVNKVDNVIEYKSQNDGAEGTQVVYSDITTLAPILVKGKGNALAWKLVSQLYSSDFIWHKAVKITVNETSYSFPPDDPITKVQDNGNIYERHIYTGPKAVEVIKAIALNYDKDVAIRFVAEKGRRDIDVELDADDKYKFKRIYELYQLLQKAK